MKIDVNDVFVRVDHYLVTVFDTNDRQWWVQLQTDSRWAMSRDRRYRHRFNTASDARQAISDIIPKLADLGLKGSILHDKWTVIAVREVETVI